MSVITSGEQQQIDQTIFKEAVRGHASGVWAGAAVGMGYGLISGGVIGLVPMIFSGAVIAPAAWLGLTAISGAIGAVTGMSAGGDNGSNAGAVSGGAKLLLHEIRSEFDDLKKDISALKKHVGMDASMTARDDVLPSGEQLAASAGASTQQEGWFNASSLLMGAMFGALIGVVLASALTAQGAGGSISDMAIKWMENAGFSGNWIYGGLGLVGAAHGGLFGFNIPRVASAVQSWARGVINKDPQEPAKEMAPEKARTPELALAAQPELPANDRVVSFQDYLEKRKSEKNQQPTNER